MDRVCAMRAGVVLIATTSHVLERPSVQTTASVQTGRACVFLAGKELIAQSVLSVVRCHHAPVPQCVEGAHVANATNMLEGVSVCLGLLVLTAPLASLLVMGAQCLHNVR